MTTSPLPLQAASALKDAGGNAQAIKPVSNSPSPDRAAKSQLGGDVYFVLGELKHVGELKDADPADKAKAASPRE